jgi:hypothetical protein
MHSRMLGREALVELEQQTAEAVPGAMPGVAH